MLRMSAGQLEWLRRDAEQHYPRECCGALLARRSPDVRSSDAVEVAELVRCANASDTPHNGYAIDPAELIPLQRTSRERNLEIVGFYHSHPEHPARPSARDLEDAYWTGCSYVIVAVERGRATGCASFLLRGDGDSKRFEAEEILV
jgi:proteasome lid subunit RPN8/RPN11